MKFLGLTGLLLVLIATSARAGSAVRCAEEVQFGLRLEFEMVELDGIATRVDLAKGLRHEWCSTLKYAASQRFQEFLEAFLGRRWIGEGYPRSPYVDLFRCVTLITIRWGSGEVELKNRPWMGRELELVLPIGHEPIPGEDLDRAAAAILVDAPKAVD